MWGRSRQGWLRDQLEGEVSTTAIKMCDGLRTESEIVEIHGSTAVLEAG